VHKTSDTTTLVDLSLEITILPETHLRPTQYIQRDKFDQRRNLFVEYREG
jgi:hypothetical protein